MARGIALALLLAGSGCGRSELFDEPPPASSAPEAGTSCRPISLGLTLPVSAAWTDTGVDVQANARLLITTTGTVRYGPLSQQRTDANGGNWDGQKFFAGAVLPNTVVVSVIGKVGGTTALGTGQLLGEGKSGAGDGFVGTDYDRPTPSAGRLFLGFNDLSDSFYDNSLTFTVSLSTACPPAGGPPDAGSPDAGRPDAGRPDAGRPDAGRPDAGAPDAGAPDAGPPDAGPPDAGSPGAGSPDAGPPDAGAPDAGLPCQPVVLAMTLPSSSAWTDTGLNVQANARLLVSAAGLVRYGPLSQQLTDANGGNWDGQRFFSTAVLPNAVVVSVIGKVGGTTALGTGQVLREGRTGDGDGFVGVAYDRLTPDAGRLFLGFNDLPGSFYDNSGSFAVTITAHCP